MHRARHWVARATLAIGALGCCPATPSPSTFTVDAAQFARLGGGAVIPSREACEQVCFELVHGIDANVTDGGPVESVPYYERAECSLAGRTLTCRWPHQCMPG